MSGGVDSSAAAFLLREEGHEVVGLTLRLWHCDDDKGRPGGCCSLAEIYDARRVCDFLGIRHYVLNMEEEFKDAVVEDFVSEYLAGRTPNPCIVCNEKIKFGLLLDKARGMGFEYLATGHYARVEKQQDRFLLKKGADRGKDQSYVLYRLKQKELEYLLFPLGGYTKKEIRKIALDTKLPVAEKPESQEICFVDKDYGSFLNAYSAAVRDKIRPGAIKDAQGKVVGHHKGLPFYTIGQRRGLGLTSPLPLYVTKIDVAANTVHVGEKAAVYVGRVLVDRLSWVEEPLLQPFAVEVKIRRMHEAAPATVTPAGDTCRVEFTSPQMAVTPGQAAVFYQGETVVGGGVIAESLQP
jgi:tRNA-specific 2-thiouridylase